MNLSALSTVLTLLPLGKGDPTWGDNPALTQQFLPAIWETLLMVFFGTLFTVLIGLPLGLLLVQTSKTGLTPNKTINQIVGLIVNVGRSFPFLILIIVLLPVTKFVMRSAITWQGATFPLVIGAIPFFARLVETNLLSVENGKVEAALMAGASNRRIRWSILVRDYPGGLLGNDERRWCGRPRKDGDRIRVSPLPDGHNGLLGRCDHHHRSVNSNDWRHAQPAGGSPLSIHQPGRELCLVISKNSRDYRGPLKSPRL